MAKRKAVKPKSRRSRAKPRASVTKTINEAGVHKFKRMTQELYLTFETGGIPGWALQDSAGAVPAFTNFTGSINIPGVNQGCFVGIGLVSRLSDVLNTTEFSTLFDSYKICGTKIDISRQQGEAAVSNSADWNALPEIISVADYDDAVGPTSLSTLLQYENVKVRKLNSQSYFRRFVKPKCAENVFKSSGTGIGFVHRGSNPWVDCMYPDVEHYGHKFIINNLPRNASGNTGTIRILVTHYLKLKAVR